MKPPQAASFAPVFTDGTVLQRDRRVPLWGHAFPGERLVVTFRGRRAEAVAGPDGRWAAALEPMPAASSGADLVLRGSSCCVLRDVVVGEVWLCSGQSNMEFEVKYGLDASREMADGDHPLIRHLKIEREPASSAAGSVRTSGWTRAAPETVGDFSAAGYFFARELRRRIDVPVGLVNSTWGGTPIESWLPAEALRRSSAYPAFRVRWEQDLRALPGRLEAYPALERRWLEGLQRARETGTRNPVPWPHPPIGPGTAYEPGALFNGMIAPLAPYGLRGILWYQGESNVPRAEEYSELFAALIREWRAAWRDPALPFLFAQLAGFNDDDPAGTAWPLLREAQQDVLAVPGTGMAVTLDIGDPEDNHPKNKQELGRRLAALALRRVHGWDVEDRGPAFRGAIRESGSMRVYFDDAAGLNARTPPVRGFEVAGGDRVFHPADATIEGDSVLASSPAVPAPVAVRYGWSNYPDANLRSGGGFPAAPFRFPRW